MKIKKFAIERLEFDVEYVNPIFGRLYLLFNYFKLIKFAKIQPCIWDNPVCKPIYRIYMPKINIVK